MRLPCLRYDVQAGRIFIGMLEVDVAGNEAVFHHQRRINQLACTGHPHFVPGLTLGRSDWNLVVPEHLCYRLRLAAVADAGGCGMGVDVADLRRCHTGMLQTKSSNDRAGPATLGVEMWSPFPEKPHPTISHKMGAPRFKACS